MRGSTLNTIVEQVRNECATSSNPSRGIDNRPYIEQLVRRYYEFLCDEFDWTFLRVDNNDATKPLAAGQRYYDFPVLMDIHDTISADVFWNNIWTPLGYGIGPEEYTAFNSDADVRAEPPLKWRVKDDRQFEVWPIPDSDDVYSVRFKGKRRPNPLVDPQTDRCDMDDMVISLFASAEILTKSNQKDAELKLSAAQKRLSTLRAGYSDRRKVRIGMGGIEGNPRLNTELLVYRSVPASN